MLNPIIMTYGRSIRLLPLWSTPEALSVLFLGICIANSSVVLIMKISDTLRLTSYDLHSMVKLKFLGHNIVKAPY
ncbi:hypothetical protein BDV35DRAFT_356377 [Aspergillus flavus]|uniref:Uncharacterized protein n=1 Tax=Aspergillus flavus TaxID=5059 RepID=A0A5N6GWZ6_ASPFL|nr:hypothetical protein BDV35DRAFT_356377 [Aspergillus flavus]